MQAKPAYLRVPLWCLFVFLATPVCHGRQLPATGATSPQSNPLPAQSDPQALAIIAKAVTAFSIVPVTAVEVSGTAHAVAGSTDETGTFQFTLNAGSRNLQLTLNTLSRTEAAGADAESCTLAKLNATALPVPNHNCRVPLDWLMPSFTLQNRLQSLTARLLPQSNSNQIEISGAPVNGSAAAKELLARISKAVVTFTPDTGLPSQLEFNLHPDDDAKTDIPIRIVYSDYRQVNGVTLPFRIEKYLNNGLTLELQVDSALIH